MPVTSPHSTVGSNASKWGIPLVLRSPGPYWVSNKMMSQQSQETGSNSGWGEFSFLYLPLSLSLVTFLWISTIKWDATAGRMWFEKMKHSVRILDTTHCYLPVEFWVEIGELLEMHKKRDKLCVTSITCKVDTCKLWEISAKSYRCHCCQKVWQ